MTSVLVEPDETARELREYVREHPDLRSEPYDGPPGTVHGHCYLLAEAYYHAQGGQDSGFGIYCLSWSDVDDDLGGTHWYLRDPDRPAWIDLGVETPEHAEPVPFEDGTRRAFITGYEPSNRTERVLDEVVR